MPYELFLRPRLKGARFNGGVIPLDTLTELQAYADLIAAMARSLFFRRHPDRQRVRKGFKDESRLVLVGTIEEGSAMPQIARFVPEGQAALFADASSDDITEARDIIGNTIDAAARGKPLPEEFDPDLLPYFARLGRHLRQEESIELIPHGEKRGPVFDLQVRRNLISRVPRMVIEEPIEIEGVLHGVDVKAQTFTFEVDPETDVPGQYDALWGKSILAALAATEQNPRTRARVHGVGRLENDRLTRITQLYEIALLPEEEPALPDAGIPSAERVLEAVTTPEVSRMLTAIKDLGELKDGWLDGKGKAPSSDGLRWLAGILRERMHVGLPYPYLYPTDIGGVLAEWDFDAWRVSARFDLEAKSAYLHAWNAKTDEEREAEVAWPAGTPVEDDLVKFVRAFEGGGHGRAAR